MIFTAKIFVWVGLVFNPILCLKVVFMKGDVDFPSFSLPNASLVVSLVKGVIHLRVSLTQTGRSFNVAFDRLAAA